MYGEPEDVLSILACTQKLIDSNERVLANIDDQQKDYRAAINDVREQLMTILNEIRASSSSI